MKYHCDMDRMAWQSKALHTIVHNIGPISAPGQLAVDTYSSEFAVA